MVFLAIMVLPAVIVYFGALIAFFLAAGMVPLAILCLVLIPLALLFIWRIIYPWLVRMGRWSAQLRNLVFLAFILTAIGIGIGYVIPDVPTITIPLVEWEVPATVLVFGLLFLFLLLLGLVVWLGRLWRRGWPLAGDSFLGIGFWLFCPFLEKPLGISLGLRR